MTPIRKLIYSLLSSALMVAGGAQAQISDDAVKIGILTDMSGTYSDIGGPGAVAAAEMAIADQGGKVAGKPITLVTADHQNKADIAATKAREWVDVDKVDVLAEMVASSTAHAVQEIARQNNKITIFTGPGSSKLTNEDCSPTGIHWAYDTYAMAVGTGKAVVQEGGDTWFFLTADYVFGEALQSDTAKVVEANGGKVVGSVKHPFPTSDFSSYILQAQGSGAKIIGLANAGSDTVNAIKTAQEFGVVEAGQKLAGLLVFLSDVHSLGLEAAQGLLLTTGFYWDYDEQTREWSQRFFEKTGKMPSMVQAGLYSGLTQYFKVVEALGTDDPDAVMAKMRETTFNDFFARNGKLRADGRMVHDMYLAEVKKPEESKGPWDYYKILRVIPGDEAYLPLSESGCTLVKK